MSILVTGSKGFIGKNLIAQMKNKGYTDINECDRQTSPEKLEEYCRSADYVFHLAGVNRPDNVAEFMDGNVIFTERLLNLLKKNQKTYTLIVSSSIQAELDNPYGKSKKAMEDLVRECSESTGTPTLIYRFPNVFGKWSKPNYNSVVATFCHNIARDLPVQINDPKKELHLVYIDDLVNELMMSMESIPLNKPTYKKVEPVYAITLQKLVETISLFKESRDNFSIPNMSDDFTKKLYSTYLSFLPQDDFSYPLKMNIDHRGSFTELIKTPDYGQVSINISKPGVKKGEHWHHTKNEKFIVVSGEGVIRFRHIYSEHIIEYFVSGEKLEVVDIPVGYTHNIENLGKGDMVTVMWANELFDPKNPDTYYLEV